MNCVECGKGTVEVRHENYHYKACGLDHVTLLGIEVRHCECGENEYVIPDVEGLHSVVAYLVAQKPEQLVPREIRFLRKYLGLSSAKFAGAMGVRPETISRWERVDYTKKPMNKGLERLLRLMVLNERPATHYAPEQVAELGALKPAVTKLKVENKDDAWVAREVRAV